MAVSCDVPPTVSTRALGVRVTKVIVGLGGLTVMMAGALLTLLQIAVTEAVPLAIAATVPPPDTKAMSGLAEVQELGAQDATEASL